MQPPQNPYSGMPGPNDPLPPQQPYGTPPSGGGSPSGRGPVISFDTIGEAWKYLQPNIGPWIGAGLIYAVVVGVLAGLQATVGMSKDQNGVPHIGPLYFVLYLITLCAANFFIGGFFRMALATVRTGRTDMGLLFSAADVFPALIGAGILTAIAVWVGTLCCIVPGLLLAGLLMFTSPLIVDQKLGPVAAMSKSIDALKPQMWMALLYFFVVSLVAGLGAIACGVGAFVTGPLAIIAIALTYRDFFDGGTSNFPSSYPNAPIADPRN